MLYQILKPVVTAAVHIFYKKIEISNRERLNEAGPTLIVSNHNNAFLDAVAVEMFAKPQIYSVARGDVFNKPLVRSILTALRIIPIYRKGEAEGMMEKNEATFERCVELLEQKEHIIMYPEGDCVTEKRLRKLKKGAARIVLRAEAKNNFNLNVRVLPIGLNYSAAKNFRSNLFINIGEPIYLKDYKEQYEQDSVKAINNFTQELEGEMRKLIVDIYQHSNDRLYEDTLALYKPQLMQSLKLDTDNLQQDYQANCQIATAINYFHNADHDSLKQFKHQLRDYHEALDKLKLSHGLFVKEKIEALSFFSSAGDLFLVGLGMPMHLIGIALNYLPYRYAYNTADKKVKQVHFHASVNFVIGMFGWIGYYLFQLLLVALFSKSGLITLAFALLIPATGWYSLQFYSFMKKVFARWNLFTFTQNNGELTAKLLFLRQQLINDFSAVLKNTPSL